MFSYYVDKYQTQTSRRPETILSNTDTPKKKSLTNMFRFLTSKSDFAIKQLQVCLNPTQQHTRPKYQEKPSYHF